MDAVAYPSDHRTSKSPASTCVPDCTSSSATRPAFSAYSVVSIFIASSVNSFCPAVTSSPAAASTRTTSPGIGAPTSRASPGRAFGRPTTRPAKVLSITTVSRGWPFSSRNTVRLPSDRASPTVRNFRINVLPRSMSILVSSPGSMPWKNTGVGSTLTSE